MGQPKVKILTPKGTAIWPRLNDPDRRYKPEGEFKITLRLKRGNPGVNELLDQLNGLYQEHITESERQIKAENAKAAKTKGTRKEFKKVDPPWKDVLDDNDTATGEVDIKFALKARVSPRDGEPFDQKVSIFDSKNKPTTARVGGGSTVRVAAKVHPWLTALGAGISLWLTAVQVLDLVAPGGDGGSYGFGEEDDGYTADDSSEGEPLDVASTEGADDAAAY